MRRFTFISHICGVILLAGLASYSCARIDAPSGGPKDKEPPVILKSVPENGSRFFSSRSFTVTFNEYIVLDKINEKFMVSPPLKTKPVITLRGKDLIVKWDEELSDSTTYTFYFQDAIRDNNENNPINNYQYFFSTGSIIDSLSLSGNVFNGEDLEASQEMLVMMYSNLSDTAPQKTLPTYISKPDNSGGFVLRNLKPGRYRLYALNDINGNKFYDGGEERFAFTDSIIEINPVDFFDVKPDTVFRSLPKSQSEKSTTTTALAKPDIFTFGRFRMYSFIEEQKKQYLTASDRKTAGSLFFTLSQPADTSEVQFSIIGTPDTAWFVEQNDRRDTFRIWITDPEVYKNELLETLVRYPFTDSTGTLIYKSDTVKMRFITRQTSTRGGSARRSAASYTTNVGQVIKPGTIPSFEGNFPVYLPDTSRIVLVQTIDTIKTRLIPLFLKDEKNSRKIRLVTPLIPGASYVMVCRKGSFTDIYDNQNDSLAYKFRVAKADEYGTVSAKISGYNGKIIVQLLDDKEAVVKQKYISSPGKVFFDLVDKGKYRLKVIYDLDGNEIWTTGSFADKRLPEPVLYYPDEIEVKINWDWELDQDWDISKENTKGINLRKKPEAKSSTR